MRRASASKAYKLKAYKYRIYPDDAQVLFFAKTFGCCRFVWNKRTFIQVDRFFPFSKLCHRCGYKKDDLVLHDRTWCCPACGEIHDRDLNASINLYCVGLGRPEVTYFEQALVDDRSHPVTKQEAQPSTVEQSASRFD